MGIWGYLGIWVYVGIWVVCGHMSVWAYAWVAWVWAYGGVGNGHMGGELRADILGAKVSAHLEANCRLSAVNPNGWNLVGFNQRRARERAIK